MTGHTQGLLAGSLLAMAVALLAASSSQSADEDDKEQFKEAQKVIARIASTRGGDRQAAANAARKYTLEQVMHAFKPRAKGGMGVGDTPGKVTPDGIEGKIIW